MSKNISIAIVEDDSDIQDMLIEILSRNKEFKVIGTYENKKSALKNIPLIKPEIVLMDIALPDGTGIEIIKELKPKFPKIEYMICTTYEDDAKVMDALEAGASSYVLKRSAPDFIVNAVKELYEGGSPMSPDIARIVVKRINKYAPKNNTTEVLTQRESEILELLAKGYLYKEVADILGISINTLKVHCYNIYKKLHVNNKIEAINLVNKR